MNGGCEFDNPFEAEEDKLRDECGVVGVYLNQAAEDKAEKSSEKDYQAYLIKPMLPRHFAF